MARAGRGSTAAGVGAGTAAGLVWGLAFLLPVLLHGWTAVTVTAGRYIAYGAVSLILFIIGGRATRDLARCHWRPALAFAITGNVGYYLLLVLGIELVGAPVTDIVIGCIPVTLALAGNVSSHSYRWWALAVPVTLVIAGLLIVNLAAITAPAQYASMAAKLLGVLAACGAVVLWTWYGLANARFLNRHRDVSHVGWSTVVGLGTGVITVAAVPLAVATHQLGRTGTVGPGVAGLVGASLVLGVLVSWAATGLWNQASAWLSTTAAGMLINVETVSGYGYVYAARAQWPPASQLIGFALILVGVMIVVRLPAEPSDHTIAAKATGRPAHARGGGEPERLDAGTATTAAKRHIGAADSAEGHR
jgi:drug/metabolite transporter (DMT)-like permease